MEEWRGHILLFNKPAEKQDAWPVSIIKRVSSVDALKGELLIAIPRDKIVGRSDGAKPHNYRLVKDETISLRAETEDVAPLSDHELHLLEAIKSPLVCYEAFVSDKVEWGRSLKLGYVVYVTIPGKTPTSNVRVSAIVRYAGQTTSHSGILFGVEIMDEAYHRYGTTDGTFHGTRHFTCKDNCGLFVALDRISPARDHGSSHTEPLREGQSQQYDHRYGLRSQPKLSSIDDTESQFKVGERVIVYNKKDVAIHGTVMWAGVVSDGKALRVLTVGVETDIPVKREDFEDAIPVRQQMFKVSASHHGRVYLPEAFVVREKEGAQGEVQGFQEEHSKQLTCQAEEVKDGKSMPLIISTLYEEKEHLEQECSLLRRQLSQQSQASQKLQQEYTGLEHQLSQVSEQHQQEKKEKLLLQEQQRLLHEEKRHFQEECAMLQQQVIQQREAAAQAAVQYHQEVDDLQQRLDTAHAEMQQLRPSSRTRVLAQDIDPWKVSRSEVQILSEMGRGAWGYVAKGRFRGQLVAVKSPHPEILDKHTTERLRREVSIMTQVRHPNLLRIVAAVFDNQVPRLPPLIVTELLDMNLRAAYQNNRLSGSSRIPIFRDVAYALHYLHEHQEPIIHRDVSAPNVLLEELPNGMFRAKVSDFGSANLAKLAQTLAEGAIIYAAPETFPPRDLHSPPPPQTTKIDVYSYGILLCEVITCQLPDPQRLWSMLQEVKRQWTYMYDLIVSCTQHSPEDRLTMAQVLDKLNQLPRAQSRHRS